ncbi:MAG: ORF6N domain-containing protein [Elusimicrobiota bacterium]
MKRIEKKILLVRGQKVMLSTDLAKLYGVEPRTLIQAVKRNIERFPYDFMFQLDNEEFKNLKSQFVISSWGGLRRAYPYAFTEQGVAMLSSVLSSRRAIQVNIGIMRVFANISKIISANKKFTDRINALECKVEKHDKKIRVIFKTIHSIPSAIPEAVLISPEKPFSNKKNFKDIIRSCRKYIYWVDKYFSEIGLELLSESVDFEKVKIIKILTSAEKVNEKLEKSFRDFKVELKNNDVICKLKVITDNKIRTSIHDRWLMSDNFCFNLPSTDTLARGQYSEIKKTLNRPPFAKWWNKSTDIIKG